MSNVQELIVKLEKATGPDREIDCLIFEMLRANLKPSMRGMYYGEPTGEYFSCGDKMPGEAPHFTSSIDAALTLVPEDCDYIRFVHDPSGSGWEIGKFSGPTMEYTKLGFGVSGGLFAIALCIASLRAIGALNED